MKKRILFVAAIALLSFFSTAQEYTEMWGMTRLGGNTSQGNIFVYEPSTNFIATKFSFDGSSKGDNPTSSLILVDDFLFGTAFYGGTFNGGVLFKYDPYNESYQKLKDFNYSLDGAYPLGSLIIASNGKIYGMTQSGGSNGVGVIYEFDINTSVFVKKRDLSSSSYGAYPEGGFIEANDGFLYGMTSSGGASGKGTIIRYDFNNNILTKLYDLTALDGQRPWGNLFQASNGKLYGLTSEGGSNNGGTIFEFDISSGVYTKLYDFIGSSGASPYGNLIQAVDGKLYGLTVNGGNGSVGVLFSFDLTTNAYTKLVDFHYSLLGSNPYGSLYEAKNGKLYGLLSNGGVNNCGTIIQFDIDSGIIEKKVDLHNLNSGRLAYYNNLIEICSSPEIIVQPINAGLCESTDTLFAVKAIGNNLTYQWQVNDGTGFTNIVDNGTYSGASNDTINLTGVLSIMNGYTYRCEITSDCPAVSIYSDTVLLAVNPVYAFTESHSICQGETYTWQGSDYTEANTYTASYLSVNGCDSIYTLNLTVNPVYAFTDNHSICEGETYTWQGTDYTEANTYTASYLSVNGCDSIYTLNLTVNPVYAFTESHSICEGETYTWQGTDYTEANTYTASYLSVNGCDSIYTLNLTVNPVYAFTENHSICQGETYTWQGTDYTEANTYTASYLSVNGCDSIYTLNLTVNPVYAFTENHSICEGEAYTWQGTDYTEANTYTASYLSANGCDSIYTLNLTVNPVYAFTENHSICEGETYTWQGTDYTEANTYTASYLSVNGCDSIYTLNLTVNPVYAFTENHSICQGETYTWQGTDYTEANTYTASYLSANGCDSIYTLNLTVNPVYAFTENHSICQGETYTWQGSDYTEENTYIASYLSVNGCDSIFTLNLTVNPVYEFTESATICDNESYFWQGENYGGVSDVITINYTSQFSCDSTYILNLTVNPTYIFEEMLEICEGETFEWQGETYTAGGYLQYQKDYESVFACDSIYILHMNINELPVVSITGLDAQYCDNITSVQLTGEPEGGVFNGPGVSGSIFNPSSVGQGVWDIMYIYSDANECENFATQTVEVYDCSGIENEIASSVLIYPNPNSGDFTISLKKSGEYTLAIYNSLGQIVWSQNTNMSEQQEYAVSGLVPGTYILKLVGSDGIRNIKIIVK